MYHYTCILNVHTCSACTDIYTCRLHVHTPAYSMYIHLHTSCTHTHVVHVHTPAYIMYIHMCTACTPVYSMYTHLYTSCTHTCLLHVPVYFMYICLYTSCTYTCILHVHSPVYCTYKLNTHCHVTNQKLYKSHPKGSGGWGVGTGSTTSKTILRVGMGSTRSKKRSHIQTCNQLLNVHTKNNTHTHKSIPKCS